MGKGYYSTDKKSIIRGKRSGLSPVAMWTSSIAIGLLFAIVTALMCRHGAEVPFVDSLNYFRFFQTGQWKDLPVIHGIGYALYLAAFVRLCPSLQAATMWSNVVAALAFGTVFCFWMIRRFGWQGVLVTVAVLTNLAILEDYGAALSEGLFLACLTIAFAMLDAWGFSRNKCFLVVSCVFMAVTCLTRYAGVAFAGVTCLMMWLENTKRIRGFGLACAYGTACMTPLFAVLVFNRWYRGSTTAHVAGFHPAGVNEWVDGCSTISSWLMPDRIWMVVPFLASVIGLVVLSTCLFHGIIGAIKRDRVSMTWAFAVLGHLSFLWLSYTFFDCDLGFTRRLLSPTVLFLFLGLAYLLEKSGKKFWRVALWVAFAYLTCFNVQRAIPFVRERCENGAGWWGKHWEHSPVVGKIVEASRERPVYSNAAGPLAFRGCLNIRGIPWAELPTSGMKNEQFEKDYAACVAELESGRAILGKVDFCVWFKRTAPVNQIVSDAGLVKLAEYDDGTIWGIPTLEEDLKLLP